ncbi:MAG: hypothetical protein ACI9C9_002196 [Marivirga sp.]|jgi:hypothetical protein
MKRLIVTLIIYIFTGYQIFSQPGGGPPGDPGDNPVPITGIEYLLAAGAAFGAKKIYEKKKAK